MEIASYKVYFPWTSMITTIMPLNVIILEDWPRITLLIA